MESKKTNILCSYDSPFLNTDALFMEYDDVLKSPFLVLLCSINNNDTLNKVFDMTEIQGLNIGELCEWYVNRKNQNIFLSLPFREGIKEKYFNNDEELASKWCIESAYEYINQNNYFVNDNTTLNFYDSLNTLIKNKINMIKKYYVYTPVESQIIREDILSSFGKKVEYVYGNLKDVLIDNELTSNSTFVFSDIKKIYALKETGLLNMSSVCIADRYAYNYKSENEYVIDINALYDDKTLFKIDFFDNINEIVG